jgi:hypothetical protein
MVGSFLENVSHSLIKNSFDELARTNTLAYFDASQVAKTKAL